MKVVIAFDKFKGSLTAPVACEIVKRALLSVRPDLDVVVKPMADGGEGTARAMIAALDGQWISKTVTGPLAGRQVAAGFGWFAKLDAAVIEMAAASGLALLPPPEYDPLRTTTYGTGELISAAIPRGARRIWLAAGGSATVDGGVGAAMALGWQFLDSGGKTIGFGGGELKKIARIIAPTNRQLPSIEVLCDVDNPLCGEQGAAHVFGPQKGATPAMVTQLDTGLRHLATQVHDQFGKDILSVPGTGAAGGLGAGALAFMNATLVSGFDTIIEYNGLQEAMAGADWVITGEGRLDAQSLRGKVVAGIAGLALAHGAKVAVLAGQVVLAEDAYRPCGISVAMPLQHADMTSEFAVANAGELLESAAIEFASTL